MTTALPLNQISASDAAAAIAAGKLTSEALVAACLERIRVREDQVQAWAFLDPELALAQSRSRDREPPRSRLHGIPFGIKDVLPTFDMPTEYGSPIYRDHRPSCDAACVAQVRELGGVVLGKTVSAVKSYWQQQIFAGREVPPVEKTSDAEVIAFVKANRGAVGYVSDTAAVTGVRVLRVDE